MIRNYISRDVQYVDPDQPLTDVARLMREFDCGTILVAKDDRLAGVITDRDIVLRCVAESMDPTVMTADQCKTPDILYCFEDDDVEETLENLADNKVRRLVVLDNPENKNMVGIISFGDLTAACKNKALSGQAMEEIRKAA